MTRSTEQSTIPWGRSARSLWGLAEDLTFLNHGSFGAVPLELLERAATLRRELERNPVDGMWRSAFPGVRRAVEQVSAFVGAPASSSGFVSNATAGLNAVLASLPMQPGDEILHLDHGYFAIWQTLKIAARRRGVEIRQVSLALPVSGPEAVVRVLTDAITARTKLIVIDQITSPTALRLPVAEIVVAANARGVEVVIDGAHAPGMLERPASEAPGAAAWTGNLHKWPCALRGCALLSVRPDLAGQVHAPVISHHLDQGLTLELDWQGTIDPTPLLLAPEAIAFMDRFGGWDVVRRHNHALATAMHAMLCERLGVEPISPLTGSMLGSMATVRLPDALQPGVDARTPEQVQAELLARDRIELPILDFCGARYLRISCHVYNEEAEYERLAAAVLRASRAVR
jgi:isopenicillin-N epimerase